MVDVVVVVVVERGEDERGVGWRIVVQPVVEQRMVLPMVPPFDEELAVETLSRLLAKVED